MNEELAALRKRVDRLQATVDGLYAVVERLRDEVMGDAFAELAREEPKRE